VAENAQGEVVEDEGDIRRDGGMKQHVKKKLTRATWKALAKAGKIVRPDGTWANRGSVPDNAMKRDFHPQGG
jgi:hypothetical protein